jgi:hypothetical protein
LQFISSGGYNNEALCAGEKVFQEVRGMRGAEKIIGKTNGLKLNKVFPPKILQEKIFSKSYVWMETTSAHQVLTRNTLIKSFYAVKASSFKQTLES